MSEEFTCGRNRKLSPDCAKRLAQIRDAACDFVLFESESHLPEWKDKFGQFLNLVFELTRPPLGPREIADLVDVMIITNMERGMSLERAVPYARRSVVDATNKSFAAVKSAHRRYGKEGVAKPQNLPR